MLARYGRLLIVFAAAVSALGLPLVLASPTSAGASPSVAATGTTSVGPSGGPVTMHIVVHGGKICRYTAGPDVVGFSGTAACTNGGYTRTGRLTADTGGSRYVSLNVKVISGSKFKDWTWVVVQHGASSSPTTTTSAPSTTTTLGKGVIVKNFSGSSGTSAAGFTTTVPETLVWSWVNGNGDYASGFGIYNMYTDTYIVNYELNPTGTTLNSAPGANGSLTLPPGTYWLNFQAIGPWTVTIS